MPRGFPGSGSPRLALLALVAVAGCTAEVARSEAPGPENIAGQPNVGQASGVGGGSGGATPSNGGAGGLAGAPAVGGGNSGASGGGATGGTGPSACTSIEGPGAPVPMRRLTASQVERTIASVLSVDVTLNVEDERLLAYRSNISTSVDAASARGYFDFASTVVADADLSRCATDCRDFLFDDVGRRLFRRALDDDERGRYDALFDLALESVDAEQAAGWVLEAMLQSPTFLYLDEVVSTDGLLDDHSMAARLALLLWGENPDDALLTRAESGDLSTVAAIEEEIARLLADPRSEEGMREFVDQWFDLARLDDPDVRPDLAELGAETVNALRAEPVLFFHRLLREGGGLGELLTSPRTVASPFLEELYGSDIVTSSAEDFELDPARRGGLLALPGVAAALSHARRTSPTLRGKAVLTGLLCTPPEPPPADVDTTLPEIADGIPTRARLEQHMSAPACMGCHVGMDGIGFTLEKIDWLGRFREEEAGVAINDLATFPVGASDVTVQGTSELGRVLADSPDVAVCVARQWLRYSGGITESQTEGCLVDALSSTVRDAAGLEQMIVQTLTSDWFRRGPGAAP